MNCNLLEQEVFVRPERRLVLVIHNYPQFWSAVTQHMVSEVISSGGR
jgi:hypothetical protein